MPIPVEVRFKGNRKAYYHGPEGSDAVDLDDRVIVEAERGFDFGVVSAVGDTAEAKCGTSCAGCSRGDRPAITRAVVRRASEDDTATATENRRTEESVRQTIIDRVRSHRLEMKVSDTEWQWDRATLTVYFTADSRVDFRALVRDLASRFRTRIDLRQIGVRDEAARLGGIGRCGREFCCSTWLTDLSPVSLSLAKDQRLSLNPAQISGGCGRLLCCLKYEHEFYVTSRKRFPKEGKRILTTQGQERVVAVDIFRERIFLRHDELGTRIIPLVDLVAEQAAVAAGEVTPPTVPTTTTEHQPAPTRAPTATRPRRPERPSKTESAAPKKPAPNDTAPTPGGDQPKRKRRRRGRRRRRGGPPPSTPEA